VDDKNESSWEDSERVGPYQLHEQVTQSSPGQDELYGATHETSGAPALVPKPASEGEDGSAPLPDLQVRYVSSASSGYIAVEVVRSPWTFAPGSHSVDELVCTVEDLHAGVSRMARLLADSEEPPRPQRRLGRARAGVALLTLTLVLLPASREPVSEVRQQAQVVEGSEEEAWDTDVNVDPVPLQAGEAPRPVRNQKKAPCTEGLEVEVSGVCWLSVTQRPCPPQTRAWQGQCLLPVATPRPTPTSLDGGDGAESR
jgi:hypothetical protein